MRPLIIVVLFLLFGSQALAYDVRKDWHPSVPNPARLTSLSLVESYFAGMPFCFATATMLATVTLRREPLLREAWMIMGNCVLPVLGGMAVRAMWNPAWDKLPLPPRYTYEVQLMRH